jgi:hypothetical protein
MEAIQNISDEECNPTVLFTVKKIKSVFFRTKLNVISYIEFSCAWTNIDLF